MEDFGEQMIQEVHALVEPIWPRFGAAFVDFLMAEAKRVLVAIELEELLRISLELLVFVECTKDHVFALGTIK